MFRTELMRRVNQQVYEGLFEFGQIENEFDKAIYQINRRLHANFPKMSSILTGDTSQYQYDSDGEGTMLDIIPEMWIEDVIVPYVVMQLFRREGEFDNGYAVAKSEFETNLDLMFRDYYTQVPEVFQSSGSGVIKPEGFDETEVETGNPALPSDWGFG